MIKATYKEINHLVESLVVYTDPLLTPVELAESWLTKNYEDNKEKTIASVEKYVLSVLADKINMANLNKENINKVVDERFKFLLNNKKDYVGYLPKTVKDLNNIKSTTFITEDEVNMCIGEIQNINNLLTFKSLLNGITTPMIDLGNKHNLYSSKNKTAVQILYSISYLINTLTIDDERFKYLYESISRILYLFKDFDFENMDIYFNTNDLSINKEEIKKYTISDLDRMFKELENILNSSSDFILDYVLDELFNIRRKMAFIKQDSLQESAFTKSDFVNENFYLELEERFDVLAHELFDNEEDVDTEDFLNSFVEFYSIARELAKKDLESESLEEASSRIITKGTEKVTRKIGNASAKSRGMSSSSSKVGQLKRAGRIVDERASDAINKKIDQVINITKDAKREKLITGKNTIKLGKAIKVGLGIITSSVAAKVAFGPLVGALISAITALSAYALSKRTEEREKKRILLELETELKITKEKIEDAKGDNAREQKYQLMRIQASLEKEIARIKHGLRYY